MKLTDCGRGDVLAVEWPHGSDYVESDRLLRGTEQLVMFCGPFGTTVKKKGISLDARGAFVRVVDQETLLPNLSKLHIIENVDVLDVVERYRTVSLSNESGQDDLDDPLKGTVR